MQPQYRLKLVITTIALSILESCGGSLPRVVIVGAGVSGLEAAVRLLDNGFNVTILEAEDRIGGRVHSVKTGEWTVDLGAHWVDGGPGNPVFDLAEPLGLIEESHDGMNFTTFFSDGKAYPELYIDHYPEEEDLRKYHNISLRDLFYNRTKLALLGALNEKERMDSFLERMMEMECVSEGCDDLSDVSARLVDDYKKLNGSDTLGWKGKGYQSIIDLILRRHEKSKHPAVNLEDVLSLNKEVKKIRVEEDEVVVECSDGTEVKTDNVLVTVSVGVLKERMDSLFHPPLPQEKRAAIDAIGLGTVNKVILRFPTAWWPEGIDGFFLVWLPSDKTEFSSGWEKGIPVFATEQWSPHTLTAWLVGDAARQMERTPLAEVQAACMRVLRHFLGRTYTIPEPVEVIRTSWGSPHFRGSYSYRRMQAETVNISKIADPVTNSKGKEVLFFAGEATHPFFYGTVQGALQSGWREAERLFYLNKEHFLKIVLDVFDPHHHVH